jgi:hypothetical protein
MPETIWASVELIRCPGSLKSFTFIVLPDADIKTKNINCR